jgi:hypothetical protein
MLETIALELVDRWMDDYDVSLTADARRSLIERIASYIHEDF